MTTITDEQCETFIFTHDQDLIMDFEENNKFLLKKYRYVFLGQNPIDKTIDDDKIIIARDYEDNLEDYPLFSSYTGWYLLWKHNLITTKYINLFEYDTILRPDIEQTQSYIFNDYDPDMIGHVPMSTSHYHFIMNNNWVEHIFPAIKTVYKFDIEQQLKIMIAKDPNLLWSSTSNTTFKKEVFEEYMEWFYPLVPFLKDTRTAGHAHERSISFFYLTKKKRIILTDSFLQHRQMNSHKTS